MEHMGGVLLALLMVLFFFKFKLKLERLFILIYFGVKLI